MDVVRQTVDRRRFALGCTSQRWSRGVCAAIALALVLGGAAVPVVAQPPQGPLANAPLQNVPTPRVAEIRFVGNNIYRDAEIRDQLSIMPGRAYDQQAVEQDVRTLLTSGRFFDVSVKTSPGPEPNTLVVIFEVVEYPKVRYVRFVGNAELNDKSLRKQIDIAPDDPADIATVRKAQERLETYYRSKGFNKVRIEIIEGLDRKDAGVVFQIEEGPSQKVWSVDFIGNTIASDGKLKTQIQSKPPIGKYVFRGFKGFVDRKKIDEDVDRLTAFYRSLGFFDAKVGRELKFDEQGDWLSITFVIHEGPRYQIRDVSFAGNKIYRDEQLAPLLKLATNEYYDQKTMNEDVASLSDAYGSVGYVFADVKASPRYLEPGVMDLVYEIEEGDRYRVGRIQVNIVGDTAHTQHTTVLNRISLQPGEIVDIREVRASERRIQASNLFNTNPAMGPRPKITFHKREAADVLNAANEDPQVRGQSPQGPMVPEARLAHKAHLPPGDRSAPSAEAAPGDVQLWIYPDRTPARPAAANVGPPWLQQGTGPPAGPVTRGTYDAVGSQP